MFSKYPDKCCATLNGDPDNDGRYILKCVKHNNQIYHLCTGQSVLVD